MRLSSGYGRKAEWSPVLTEVLGKKTVVLRFEVVEAMTSTSELMIDGAKRNLA